MADQALARGGADWACVLTTGRDDKNVISIHRQASWRRSRLAAAGKEPWDTQRMNVLYTLAYPTISAADADRLEAFRRRHDPRHDMLAAHFTLVFACKGLDEQSYIEHVATVTKAFSPIAFSCHYAMLGTDDEVDRGYVYLVPDEGLNGIRQLHDSLYSGILGRHLRLDIPFIPHMTLGACADKDAAERLVDEFNSACSATHGMIDAITVAALRDGKIRHLAKFLLGAAGSLRP